MKYLISIFIIYFLAIFFVKDIYATNTAYDIIAPTGILTKGQTVIFTVTIDTMGGSITTGEIGMTYDTQYLEFQNVTPGNAFSTVTATPVSGGKLVISASSTSAYSGSGNFALVNFKLIAQAPGSTEICTLWAPSPTPLSTTPTTPPNQPTSAPIPTALPTTGIDTPFVYAGSIGVIFMLAASGLFLISKRHK